MMRIITGKFRGVRLDTLPGDETRPTSERVKEAVFSSIQFDMTDRRVLDLFAGSGQLGLEALSRGSGDVTFVDASPDVPHMISASVLWAICISISAPSASKLTSNPLNGVTRATPEPVNGSFFILYHSFQIHATK